MAQRPKGDPTQKRWYALVARVRLETTIVEFDASEDAGDTELNDEAIEVAEHVPLSKWKMKPFDELAEAPFVIAALSDRDFDLHTAKDPRKEARKALPQFLDDARFLYLKADVDSGEGDLVVQPWFVTEEPDLMMSDLASDWLADLEGLGLTYMSERANQLMSGARPTPTDRIIFGGKRKKPDSDDDQSDQ